MKAVILCAGLGTRLHPLTKNKPKPLIKIGDKSILEHQLDSLSHLSLEEVIVVGGFQSEQLRKMCNERFTLLVNNKYESTNSMYSLWVARDKLRDSSFIILNGDVVTTKNTISKLTSTLKTSSTLKIEKKSYDFGEMNLVEQNNKLIAIGKNLDPEICDGESGQISFISSSDSSLFFDRIDYLICDKKEYSHFPAKAYDAVIEKSNIVVIDNGNEPWYEVDTLSDLEKVRNRYA